MWATKKHGAKPCDNVPMLTGTVLHAPLCRNDRRPAALQASNALTLEGGRHPHLVQDRRARDELQQHGRNAVDVLPVVQADACVQQADVSTGALGLLAQARSRPSEPCSQVAAML